MGFNAEDYELCEEINDATDGRLRPSEAKALAEKWIQTKLRREANKRQDNGDRDGAYAVSDIADRLRRGWM